MREAPGIPEQPHRPLAEDARQLIHIVSGLWAYTLRWVGPSWLMGLALSATAFNLWLLPRVGGRWLWRPREVQMGWARGIVFYPLTVFFLLAIFYQRPEIAAAGWGLLAFGDGAATLAGRRWVQHRLPWNKDKSWAGLVAYAVFGCFAVYSLVSWIVPGRYDPVFLIWVAATVAVLGAFLESAPQRLDDNLTVPVLGSLFLWCCLETAHWPPSVLAGDLERRLLWGVAVNLFLVVLAVRLGTLNRSGAVVAYLLGTLVFGFLSWRGYVVLLTFFVLGSLATRIGYGAKSRLSLAQGRGGRRRAGNALANGGVAAACAVFAGLTPHWEVFVLAFVCSLAAAAADTVESEIGQIWGRPTVLITSFKTVEPGTNGGISAIGTVAGLVAAALTAGSAWIVGLVSQSVVVPLSLLAVSATLAESVIGATLERSGQLDNEGVNFFNTLVAAFLGAALASVMGR